MFILITVKPGNENEVYEERKDNFRVKDVYKVYGGYDIITKIEVENISELDEFHDKVLRKIKEVETILSG